MPIYISIERDPWTARQDCWNLDLYFELGLFKLAISLENVTMSLIRLSGDQHMKRKHSAA